MDTLTPHFATASQTSEDTVLDESELLVQWSEFVMHPLRSLTTVPIVLSTPATAGALE